MFSNPSPSAESHGESGAMLCNPGGNLLRTVICCHCDYNQKLHVNKSGFFNHLRKALDINSHTDRDKTSQWSTEQIVMCYCLFFFFFYHSLLNANGRGALSVRNKTAAHALKVGFCSLALQPLFLETKKGLERWGRPCSFRRTTRRR